MEFSHIFYKEVLVDEDNTFFAELIRLTASNLTSPKDIKLAGYLSTKVTALGFFLTNVEGKEAMSDILRTYAAEKDKFNLDLRIYK